MRISDWSSDVCSSDLLHQLAGKLVSPAVVVGSLERAGQLDSAAENLRRVLKHLSRGEFFLGGVEAFDLGVILRRVQLVFLPLVEIGRAHVCTPVTNAHLVCRLLLEKKNIESYYCEP